MVKSREKTAWNGAELRARAHLWDLTYCLKVGQCLLSAASSSQGVATACFTPDALPYSTPEGICVSGWSQTSNFMLVMQIYMPENKESPNRSPLSQLLYLEQWFTLK